MPFNLFLSLPNLPSSNPRLKSPRIQSNLILTVAADRLQKRALRLRVLHLFLGCEILGHLDDEQIQAPGQTDLLADVRRSGALKGEQGNQALRVAKSKRDTLSQRDGRLLIIESDVAFQTHPPEGARELQGHIFINRTVGDVDSGDHLFIMDEKGGYEKDGI